jgi:hypothetical protein
LKFSCRQHSRVLTGNAAQVKPDNTTSMSRSFSTSQFSARVVVGLVLQIGFAPGSLHRQT